MNSMTRFFSRWSPSLTDRALSKGLEAYTSGDYVRAFTELHVLARRGNASAQNILGRMYHNGEGVSVDLEEAARWMQSAAQAGVPDAQFNLGVMYEDGKGVTPDISEALLWYRRAAQWGFANAQINLSNCFHNGLGVDQDESLAAWWISLAADQGDADSQLNLGTRYMAGIGVSKDPFEAFFWFDLAAKAGSANAINFRATVTQELTPDQVRDAQRISQDSSWKPKSPEDSALQIFKSAAGQTIDMLKQTLGEERFGALRTTLRKAPSAGELILSETHGFSQATIVTNMKEFLAELERTLDLRLGKAEDPATHQYTPDLTTRAAFELMRRIDDIADVGAVLGEAATDFIHNLLEYHLALIGLLEEKIDSDSVTMLLKRFSARQTLRARNLVSYASLHNVVLPLLPW